MPQVSEIVKATESAEEPTTSIVVEAERRGQDHEDAERILKGNPDIYSIFALASQFDIPFVDLGISQGISKGDYDWRRTAYGVGAGVSCSLTRHETDQDTIHACPAGTLVALKRYTVTSTELQSGSRDAIRRLHQLIWQELQVFCHPYLREHENICKLVYIGWGETDLIPVLALELASYGTLEDALQSLRSYGSGIRKSHLSLDIALGLEALHSCNLVHGDIKPSNIIIQAHSSPRVVAKLSDFNGTAHISSYGKGSRYSFGTPTWQPPEVVCKEDHIDWQIADVYAFGMVFATIWSSTGWIPVGGSFLDPFVPYKLSVAEKNALVEIWKLKQDTDAESMTKLAHRATISDSRAPIPLEFILSRTLSCIPALRLPLCKIIPTGFGQFAESCHRSLNIPQSQNEDLASYINDSSHSDVFVMRPSYTQRSRIFKEKLFKALLQEGESLRDATNLPPHADLDENFQGSEDELFQRLENANDSLMSALTKDEKLIRLLRLATNISLSFLLGLGTRVDEIASIQWLYISACVGEGFATFVYLPLEQSLENVPGVAAPRRRWGALGANSGFQQSAACLKDIDPKLCELATNMHHLRQWGRDKPQSPRLDVTLRSFVASIRSGIILVDSKVPVRPGAKDFQETALHISAATGDMESVRSLVLHFGANVNITNLRNETPIFYATRCGRFEVAKFLLDQGANITYVSTENCSVMHCLSTMDDRSAAILAPMYFENGARLDIEAEQNSYSYQDNICRGEGIPLLWAARRKRILLYKTLLSLHKDYKIDCFDLKSLLQLLVSWHLYEMLEFTLESQGSLAITQSPESNSHTVQNLEARLSSVSIRTEPVLASPSMANTTLNFDGCSELLCEALDFPPQISLCRRYLHSSNFRLAKSTTIRMLLKYGADPLGPSGTAWGDDWSIPLSLSVCTADNMSLQIFIKHIESKGTEVLPILSDPTLYGGLNALQRTIHMDGRENFLFLIEKYPSLMNLVGAEGRRALHSAATQEWPGYATELLNRGADRYARANDRATPFIWAVMRNASLEVADLLAEDANMDEILGPDIQSGFTAFGKVLNAMTSYKMDIGMNRLKYLVDKFGRPSFFVNVPKKITALQPILLQKTPLTDHAQIALEGAMLKFLLDIFSDKIDFIHFDGCAPLHYAVHHGNLSATKILVDHGASVNTEMEAVSSHHPMSQGKTPFLGYTALDLAIWNKKRGPDKGVLEGGARENEQWQRNYQNIINLLIRSGGKSGSGSGWARLEVSIETGELSNLVISRLGVLHRGNRISDGEWPKRLPWEGPDPDPFATAAPDDEDNSIVEIVERNGLSRPISHRVLSTMQTMIGAIDKHVLIGNYVEDPPDPPPEFGDRLQRDLLSYKTLRAAQLPLPPGWELGFEP